MWHTVHSKERHHWFTKHIVRIFKNQVSPMHDLQNKKCSIRAGYPPTTDRRVCHAAYSSKTLLATARVRWSRLEALILTCLRKPRGPGDALVFALNIGMYSDDFRNSILAEINSGHTVFACLLVQLWVFVYTARAWQFLKSTYDFQLIFWKRNVQVHHCCCKYIGRISKMSRKALIKLRLYFCYLIPFYYIYIF